MINNTKKSTKLLLFVGFVLLILAIPHVEADVAISESTMTEDTIDNNIVKTSGDWIIDVCMGSFSITRTEEKSLEMTFDLQDQYVDINVKKSTSIGPFVRPYVKLYFNESRPTHRDYEIIIKYYKTAYDSSAMSETKVIKVYDNKSGEMEKDIPEYEDPMDGEPGGLHPFFWIEGQDVIPQRVDVDVIELKWRYSWLRKRYVRVPIEKHSKSEQANLYFNITIEDEPDNRDLQPEKSRTDDRLQLSKNYFALLDRLKEFLNNNFPKMLFKN